MFDGKTLEGWTVRPNASEKDESVKDWSVKQGYIYGQGGKLRSYLCYDNMDISDFEMKLAYRFTGKGNSGVSIRAQIDETGKRGFKCYHADFGHLGIGKQVLGAWDFHTPGRTEHRCFRGDSLVIAEDDSPSISNIDDALTEADIKQGDWNAVHIIAKGNHFQLFINGKLSSEFKEFLPEGQRLQRGMIQLQLHDPDMVVEFKDLKIKILK